ncbi:hypothetical protein MNL76_02200 [Fervidobacterium riparium]|nr:hypothetical protein IB67_03465 [Fervidobacterium riparium]
MKRISPVLLIILIMIYSLPFLFALEVSFFNTNIKEALNILSLDTGAVIIYEPNISGAVTIQVDADFERVLDLILMPYNYYWTKLENVYFVGISDVNASSFLNTAKFYQIPLRFCSAEKIIAVMPKALESFVLKPFEQNNLLVFAPPPIASKIASFVSDIDKPKQAYEVYVKITDISEAFLFNFRLDFSSSRQSIFAPNLLQIPISDTNLNILLNNKEDSEDFKIIYEGKVQALSGYQTKITAQRSITISKFGDGKLTSGQNITTMEMTITPRFLYNSCVMEISLKLDGIPDANELNFETRGAILQSTVNLEYGKVYLVGSFSYDKSVQKEGGIAFLKDLPIIGSLFKSYYIESEKRYVMFLVIVARSIDLLSNMNEYVQESGVDGK